MKKLNTKKHHKYFFIIIGIFILGLILATANFGNDKKIIWGATFSKKQCEILEIDWKWTFEKTIDELPIQSLRIPIYWDDVEKYPDYYDFSDYIWMFNKASEKNIEVIPVLGRRVPRWPECHTPKFYSKLSEKEIQPKILNLITQEIEFFKNYKNIKKWQIENEPFLKIFGECPAPDKKFLQSQIDLVKKMDNRKIMLTESGELSTWITGAKMSDILGISMYRKTWNKNWGYFSYPLGPSYYFFKAQIIKLLTNTKIINSELQVEPWGIDNDLKNSELFEQFYSMDLNSVKQNIKFAKRSGINEIYLWGIEWWWWLGVEHNQWDFWEYGKTL